MDYRYFIIVGFVAISTFILCSEGRIQLNRLHTLYVPYENNFTYGVGVAKQIAYDPQAKNVFVVGRNRITIVSLKDGPQILKQIKMKHNMDPVDAEICKNLLFVALDNPNDKESGRVHIYFKFYLRSRRPLIRLHDIIVGPSPSMVLPLPGTNCKKILVTLEGKPYVKDGVLIDPEGSIGIITIPGALIPTKYSFKTLDFRKFNSRVDELEAKGVRFVYRGNNNTFAKDVEPEYVTVTEDEKTAYVSLQENNAIAVVNLTSEEIDNIYPLGYKDWTKHEFAASDKDQESTLRNWPVYGMYQPDAIQTMKIAGVEYLLTANEGSAKDYSKLVHRGFDEEIRVKYIKLAEGSRVLKWAADNNITDIASDMNLGRLKISKVEGNSANANTYDELYTFGGRSFSLWRVRADLKSMSLIADSGSHIEESHKEFKRGRLFNAHVDMKKTVEDTRNKRSDNKGPECETLAIAKLSNKTAIFVGNERPGSVSIYSATHTNGNGLDVKFESIWSGVQLKKGNWATQYNSYSLSEINPEDIKFIPHDKSPNGKNMLMVAGASSGTLSLFEIVDH